MRQIAAAPLVLQHRLAVGFEDDGAAVVWDDFNGHGEREALASRQFRTGLGGYLISDLISWH